ncbi:MAG: aminodeoxychorismate synthase component I, partial [Streptomyces sp.]|uniref:aminodeoxychorismate synthase component I n=1 Tax=Streptomyces sp. TaxID=1931 RepID=UPI0025DB6466
DLGPGPVPAELVRRAAGRPGLVALVGDWAGGAAVLTSHPVRTSRTPDVLADPVHVNRAAEGFLGGGWFGRLAYDGASRLAFHDHVVRQVGGRWWFEALGDTPATAARLAEWRALLDGPTPQLDWTLDGVSGPPVERHLAAVETAIELIRAGELYQVNVCTRLSGRFTGDPAALFAAAVERLAPARAAYLAAEPGEPGGLAVVSLSPELFLRRRGRVVESDPIKGTLPRDRPGAEQALRRSAKDVAENVMIVDLVRHDLGQVSEIGSVHPTALLAVRPAPGVWHLVSTVEGRLRPDVTDADLLAATFPPGSVTGAPKAAARAAIERLEDVPRGTFTGAIGYAGPLGLELNVAIRTFEITGERFELGVGGGITADSVPMLEWQECGHKATPLLRAAGAGDAPFSPPVDPTPAQLAGGVFETLLAVDGRVLRLADHLARLDRSTRELYGAGLPEDLPERVRAAALAGPAGRAAVRVTVAPDGAVHLEVTARGAPPAPIALQCRPRPGGSWRHKWCERGWTSPDALYVAADGTVLETERGNVFLIEPDGTLVTPPLRDDLLPGVTRRAVLDLARDAGRPTALRVFPLAALQVRPAFWTSSLSLAVPIASIDGVALPRADDVVAGLAALLSPGPAV